MMKIALKTGLLTAAIAVLFEIGDQLYIYHYFRFEYYLAAVALAALAAGVWIARKTGGSSLKPAEPGIQLTNKEWHILRLISEGKSNKEIAANNFIEVSTVKTHINNLYAKLSISNRQQAICFYKQALEGQNPPFIHPPALDI